MELLHQLPPIAALVLGLVFLAWLIFAFLVPFMVEGIRRSMHKNHEQLVALNEKLELLNAALRNEPLGNQGADEPAPEITPPQQTVSTDLAPRKGRKGKPAPPRRQEPTITDLEVDPHSRKAD